MIDRVRKKKKDEEPLTRICDECETSIKVEDHVREKHLEYVPGYGDIFEIGIRCPECDHFYFAAFINNALRKRRISIDRLWELTDAGKDKGAMKQYIWAKMGYKRQFDRFNIRMSERFGRTWHGEPQQN